MKHLGDIFDGIGGFPSEIEEFPIAVTKGRIGE